MKFKDCILVLITAGALGFTFGNAKGAALGILIIGCVLLFVRGLNKKIPAKSKLTVVK